jgi:hypothetical protein
LSSMACCWAGVIAGCASLDSMLPLGKMLG